MAHYDDDLHCPCGNSFLSWTGFKADNGTWYCLPCLRKQQAVSNTEYMTTNGTGITREEAESILNMMKFSEAEHSIGSIAVLKKLQKAYPDLITPSSPFGKQITEFDQRDKITKQEATKQIDGHIKTIYELFGECEKIANKAGVSFYFDLNGTYGMGGRYSPKDQRWISSSEDC